MKVLVIEADKTANILLAAIVRSIDQDIEIQQLGDLAAARRLLLAEKGTKPFGLIILGLSSAGSRARLGFLAFMAKRFPEIQVLLVRSAKSRKNASAAEGKSGLHLKYVSLSLDLDQCRKLIEGLLK